MIGQLIFMRHTDARGLSGTYTAAMTEGIVSNQQIKNDIEPRCHLDIAQKHLGLQENRSVLRLYHISGATVATRSSIEALVNESRAGTYSISHIVTGEDEERFFKEFTGAFSLDNYETYDSVVRRAEATRDSQVTIDPCFSVFDHQKAPQFSLFQEAGFDQERFTKLMSGIYQALETGGRLSVVLPAKLRANWDDELVEGLSGAIMSLLPLFTRCSLGLATHWSCEYDSGSLLMIQGIHLVFVHPKDEEDRIELLRSGRLVLDVDSGYYTGSVTAEDYFHFLWEHFDDYPAIVGFWDICIDSYKALFQRASKKADAINAVYLMTDAEKHKGDLQREKLAFLKAAAIFASAGHYVPAAENFLYSSLYDLYNEGRLCFEPECVDAVTQLIQKDTVKTKHQELEYKIIIELIKKGDAPNSSVDVLAQELRKENREADESLDKVFTDLNRIQTSDITPNLIRLGIAVFNIQILERGDSDTPSGLGLKVANLLNSWAMDLVRNGEWFKVKEFLSTYEQYLEKNVGKNSSIDENIYRFLFYTLRHGTGELSYEADMLLCKVENRIYCDGMPALQCYQTFLNVFLKEYPILGNCNSQCIVFFYNRLLRLFSSNFDYPLEKASEAYKQELIYSSDKAKAQMLIAQKETLNVLLDRPDIYPVERVHELYETIDSLNSTHVIQYRSDYELLTTLLPSYQTPSCAVCVKLSYWLNLYNENEEELNGILKVLNPDMKNAIFVHALLLEPEKKRLLELLAPATWSERLAVIMDASFLNDETDKSKLNDSFARWYKEGINAALEDCLTKGDYFQKLGKIRKQIECFKDSPCDFSKKAKKEIKSAFIDTLRKLDLNNVDVMAQLPVGAIEATKYLYNDYKQDINNDGDLKKKVIIMDTMLSVDKSLISDGQTFSDASAFVEKFDKIYSEIIRTTKEGYKKKKYVAARLDRDTRLLNRKDPILLECISIYINLLSAGESKPIGFDLPSDSNNNIASDPTERVVRLLRCETAFEYASNYTKNTVGPVLEDKLSRYATPLVKKSLSKEDREQLERILQEGRGRNERSQAISDPQDIILIALLAVIIVLLGIVLSMLLYYLLSVALPAAIAVGLLFLIVAVVLLYVLTIKRDGEE